MVFRKGGLAGSVVVALIAITFLGCASFGNSGPQTSVDFGLRNDTQNGESMSVDFGASMDPYSSTYKFAFRCMYSGNRPPETLMMRIDNGTPIALRVTYTNRVSGKMEFGISNDLVNQLLNCNNSIDLQFNTQGTYIRDWNISSAGDEAETRRAQNYNIEPRYSSPLGIKNVINYWNNR